MTSLVTSPPTRTDPPKTWVAYLAAATITAALTFAAFLGPIHYLITETIQAFHPFLYPNGLVNAVIETTATSIILLLAGIGIPFLLLLGQVAVDNLFLANVNTDRDQELGTTLISIAAATLATTLIAAAQLPIVQSNPVVPSLSQLAIQNFTPIYALTLLLPVFASSVWIFGEPDGTNVENASRESDSPLTTSTQSTGDENTRHPTPASSRDDTFESDESQANEFDWTIPEGPGFENIGGYRDVKQQVQTEVIDAVRDETGAYERMAVAPPTGILLHGPPGTGKSLFGRALAEELGVPFTELSQADLSSKWVNETPELIKLLFEEATDFEKSVVFIDEIDGLLRERNNQGTAEDAKGVNEFLPRLAENEDVIVVAATNRKDVLDDAAIRSGRFDLKIEMGLPGQEARERILEVHLEGRKNSLDEADIKHLAMKLEGKSGADIEEVVKSAARRAASENSPTLNYRHLENQIAR